MSTLSDVSTAELLGVDDASQAPRLLPAVALTALSVAIILAAVFAFFFTVLAAPVFDTMTHLSLDTAGLSRG